MVKPAKIVFIDGYCTICNQWVQFIMKRDKRQHIHFSSIQGTTAEQYLTPEERIEVNYILYYRDGSLKIRSSAIIWILKDLGGLWRIVGILHYVPAILRDSIYNFVSRRRYKWFTRKVSCDINPGVSSKNILP